MPGNTSDRWRAQIRRAFNFTYDLWRSGCYGVDTLGNENILKVNSDGEIYAHIVSGGGGGGGGSEYTEGADPIAGQQGIIPLFLNSGGAVGEAGNLDAGGNLRVVPTDASGTPHPSGASGDAIRIDPTGTTEQPVIGAVADGDLASAVDPVIVGGNIRSDLTGGGNAKRLNTSADGDLIVHQHTGQVTPQDGVSNTNLKTAITEDDASIQVYGAVPYAYNAQRDSWDRLRQFGMTGTVDTFGRVITGARVDQVDVQFFLGSPSALVTSGLITLGNTGATWSDPAQRNGGAKITFGTGIGSAEIESVQTVQYHSGAEVYADFTVAFGAPQTDLNQYIGLVNDTPTSGFYIGLEGSNFVVREVEPTAGDTLKATVSLTGAGVPDGVTNTLSGDSLDADSGTSRFTRAGTKEDIDFTKVNVFRIRFGWLGSAPVSFDVMTPDGEYLTFHTIKQPNLSTDPHISDPNLPIRMWAERTAGPGSADDMFTNCWGAGVTSAPAWLPLEQDVDLDDATLPQPLGPLVRAVISGRNSAGGGQLKNVKVTGSGAVVIDGAVDLAEVGGTTVSTNSGSADDGTIRVVEATGETKAVYDHGSLAAGSVTTTMADLIDLGDGTVQWKQLVIYNRLDLDIEVSFDDGTTVHAVIPAGEKQTWNYEEMRLYEDGSDATDTGTSYVRVATQSVPPNIGNVYANVVR